MNRARIKRGDVQRGATTVGIVDADPTPEEHDDRCGPLIAIPTTLPRKLTKALALD